MVIEYPDGFRDGAEVDEIFRSSRHLLDNTVLSRVVTEGIGLLCTLDYCVTSGGGVVPANPDSAPDVDVEIDRETVTRLVGTIPSLRYAVRDFNQGLLHREDCPIYFYRAIEALAKVVCKREDRLGKRDWKDYHSQIGTTTPDLQRLLDINKKHRHGTRIGFTREDHIQMMRAARLFLARTIQFLEQHESDYSLVRDP